MFTAIHPTTYRGFGFLAHGMLKGSYTPSNIVVNDELFNRSGVGIQAFFHTNASPVYVAYSTGT